MGGVEFGKCVRYVCGRCSGVCVGACPRVSQVLLPLLLLRHATNTPPPGPLFPLLPTPGPGQPNPARSQLFTLAPKPSHPPVQAATSLQTLLLDHTELGEDTVAALASALGSGHCARLRHLSLASAGVTDTGAAALAAALAARTHLGHLHSLSLEGNKGVTDAFCGALAGGAPAACPHTLDLSSSGVSSAALEPLSTLPTLHKLALLGCALGDEGATVLARLLPRGFPALEDVGVSGCGIGLAGAGALLGALTAGHGAGVASVEMGSNPVCQDDGLHALIEALREARPGMMVHWRSGDMPGEKQGAPGGAA